MCSKLILGRDLDLILDLAVVTSTLKLLSGTYLKNLVVTCNLGFARMFSLAPYFKHIFLIRKMCGFLKLIIMSANCALCAL